VLWCTETNTLRRRLNNTVTIMTQGVMETATAKLTIGYGPQIPLDPPIVYDPATALWYGGGGWGGVRNVCWERGGELWFSHCTRNG
jgi:hypothetical protein